MPRFDSSTAQPRSATGSDTSEARATNPAAEPVGIRVTNTHRPTAPSAVTTNDGDPIRVTNTHRGPVQ